jgi:hypothetical protein
MKFTTGRASNHSRSRPPPSPCLLIVASSSGSLVPGLVRLFALLIPAPSAHQIHFDQHQRLRPRIHPTARSSAGRRWPVFLLYPHPSLHRSRAAHDAQAQARCLAPSLAWTLHRLSRARVPTSSPPTPCRSCRSRARPAALSWILRRRSLPAHRGCTPPARAHRAPAEHRQRVRLVAVRPTFAFDQDGPRLAALVRPAVRRSARRPYEAVRRPRGRIHCCLVGAMSRDNDREQQAVVRTDVSRPMDAANAMHCHNHDARAATSNTGQTKMANKCYICTKVGELGFNIGRTQVVSYQG